MMHIIWQLLFLAIGYSGLHAQNAGKTDFRNNEFYIEINKNTSKANLETFIKKYDLAELNLTEVLYTNKVDTLSKLGWKIVANNQLKLVITKSLFGSSNVNDLTNNIFNTEHSKFAALFPSVSDDVVCGYNKLKNKNPFAVKNGTVRFYLRNNKEAKTVLLSGSFNNWSPTALQMKKTDSGWIADVKLSPGKYWYKFIINGNWTIDADNQLRENDGMGNTNSVYYVANHLYQLIGFENAKNVYVAGNFNKWKEKELKMQRVGNGWSLPLYLAEGTHRYKFLVDDKWITDPSNKEKLSDGKGEYNSVLRLGTPTLFRLQGYANARKVILSGNFNDWRKDELSMNKTAGGWELKYILAPGNYEYKFIVDGAWMTDPSNPITVDNDAQSKNSYLTVGANYTFRIKGISNAKKVYLVGDFNNWSPNTLLMQKEEDTWIYKVHLSPGKHKYKLLADGVWIKDPGNPQWEQNEHGTGNSVIWFEEK